nr:hypothetical protein CFP56_68853 [Quercus suber]
MIILIPKVVRKEWDKWNIRNFFIISILVQILLLFTATLRKKTSNKWVIRAIWAGYLLAAWAANFAVNLIFDREEKYTDTVDDTGLLLVLWTPFLLSLLGGQDRITSLAVEDNEMWPRHLIWLILQVFTACFVCIQSLHQNRLWIPTLSLASCWNHQHAYKIANMYRGLIVNLMFSSREHRESREFFNKRSSKDALRILEIELNLFYDILHTKVEVAYSRLGKLSRFISIGLVVAALSLFYKEEKRGFKRFDIEVTYTMFLRVLGLDMVTLLLWMFSDWTIASFKMSEIHSHLASILSKIVDKLLNLRKPIWKQSERETSQSELQETATPII